MSNENNRVLLVGHCGPDSWMLKSMIARTLPDHRVELVNDEESLNRAIADGASLLLVNRVLDGRFAQESGIDLIRSRAAAGGPPMLLISNYEDAQAEAEAAGARPGFGKAALNRPEAADRLRAALAGV